MKYFHLVWAALLRRKTRTIFTMVSVLAAFLLFGMLDSVRTAFADAGHSVSGATQLITMSKLGLGQQLPLSLQSRIEAVPGVASVAYVNWFQGIYQDPKNFFPNEAVSANYFSVQDAVVLPPDQLKVLWLSGDPRSVQFTMSVVEYTRQSFMVKKLLTVTSSSWPVYTNRVSFQTMGAGSGV